MFSPRFLTAFSALLLASTSVSAAPSVIAERTVQPVNSRCTPHALPPSAWSIWNVGRPNSCSGTLASSTALERTRAGALLGPPLGVELQLGDGAANVTVFDVPTRDSYIVVLLGDSANRSDKFTINGSSASASSTPTDSAVIVAPTPTGL
ncbi:hypothetical protein BC629DRAFT_1595623 [Irpex lacteus]|nr:hypothetical protein BC629DRAFT_1595623 [Irpex lacteus]